MRPYPVGVAESRIGPVTLIWHGRGPRESHVMRPLADALVHIGADVFVPDWEWTAPDWGRGELLASLASAATVADNRPLIVIGWSLGGTAALSLASLAHYEVTALVGLAADCEAQSPLTGRLLDANAVRAASAYLVHGSEDPVVPVSGSIRFAGDSDASLTVLSTDHAGVIGCEYDRGAGTCLPSDRDPARRGLRASVRAIQKAALRQG